MISNLKEATAYLLRARKLAAKAKDLVMDYRATEAPLVALIIEERIEFSQSEVVDLEIERLILNSTAQLITEALNDAESSAKRAAHVYTQVEALRRIGTDAIDETADEYGKAIDQTIMRSEEVQTLWNLLKETQQSMLEKLPSL